VVKASPRKIRLRRLNRLLQKLERVPDSWAKGTHKASTKDSANSSDLIITDKYREVIKSWRKALKWTDGLDCALSVMLASISSTNVLGDQLWVKIIGPASCGKSTLCEAVSVNSTHVLAKSTIRGFHSGYGDGEEDHSLISQVNGKTLVIKDGDTLLQSPNLGQILSEARDVYDTNSRTSYRNKASKSYEGIRMTFILCGTSSLRSIDSSELGERFLDCVIMDGIDDDLEDEILWRVVNRANNNMALEATASKDGQHDPAMRQAMLMTGGYVTWLKENATKGMSTIEVDEKTLRDIMSLGKFVAYMRARPSKMQSESAEREFGSRLTIQLMRLAKCLAYVMNRRTIDLEVMRRVEKVALDTARGVVLNMCSILHERGDEGLEKQSLALMSNVTTAKATELLQFLRQLGVVSTFKRKKNGVTGKQRWKLTNKINTLWERVVHHAELPEYD